MKPYLADASDDVAVRDRIDRRRLVQVTLDAVQMGLAPRRLPDSATGRRSCLCDFVGQQIHQRPSCATAAARFASSSVELSLPQHD